MFSMLTILDLLTFTKSNTTQTDGKSNGIRMFDGRGRLDAFIVKRGVSTTFWPQEGHPRGHFLMFYLPPGTYKREVSQHQKNIAQKAYVQFTTGLDADAWSNSRKITFVRSRLCS